MAYLKIDPVIIFDHVEPDGGKCRIIQTNVGIECLTWFKLWHFKRWQEMDQFTKQWEKTGLKYFQLPGYRIFISFYAYNYDTEPGPTELNNSAKWALDFYAEKIKGSKFYEKFLIENK